MSNTAPRKLNDYRVTFTNGDTMVIKSYSSSRARQIAAQMFGNHCLSTVLVIK